MKNKPVIFKQEFDHYNNLPDVNLLLNPLTDVAEEYKEDSEMEEFIKLCNYSPVGRKYLKTLMEEMEDN